jgi:virginiamycin B lyase
MLRRTLILAVAVTAFAGLARPAPAGAYVYWANGGCCLSTPSIGTIGRANNDGTQANESFIPRGNNSSNNLQGLSVGANDIFWADAQNGTVGHASIDGSNANDNFIADRRGTGGVASDSAYVFWANGSAGTIDRANLDGSSPGVFLSPAGHVIGLADVAGTLYWVDNSNGTIDESPTGAASASTLLTVPKPAGGSVPSLQFVAVGGGYVYWTDSANNTIGRASLANPSATATDTFLTGASGPEGVAVDSSHIYWSNSGQNGSTANNNKIGRANLDGTGVNQSFITGASVPYGLAVDDLGNTTTGVSCSPRSASVGNRTTCTATVTNSDSATPAAPSGTVSFSSDSSGSFSGSCTLSGGSCSVTYTPSAVGSGTHSITAVYGGDGLHSGSSGSTQVTVPTPPANAAPPTISGTAQQGQTLTESHGQWSNNPSSYAYQWEDCDSGGNRCSAISGARAQRYTLRSSDVGHTMRVVETASNAGGSASATSNRTGVVSAPSPSDLRVSSSGPVTGSGSLVDPGIRLSCPAGGASCTASETVTVLIGAADTPIAGARAQVSHAVTVGSASFTIPAGSTVEGIFHLDQFGMTLLSDHKRLPLQIKVSGQAQGQTRVTATKAIMLDGRFARYTVRAIEVHRDGTVTFKVNVSAPGQVNVLLTAWKDNVAVATRVLSPARERFVVARSTHQATSPGSLSFTIHPNQTGRRLIAHPAYGPTLRLWVSYVPTYAFDTDTGYYGLHPGHGCTPCHTRTWP